MRFHPSLGFIKVIRVVLLVLIVIGLGLIATQRYWVPTLVEKIVGNVDRVEQGRFQSEPNLKVPSAGRGSRIVVDNVLATTSAPMVDEDFATSSIKIYSNKDIGVQIKIPADWLVRPGHWPMVTSSDYVEPSTGKNIVGSDFLFQPPEEVNPSLSDPNTYREWMGPNGPGGGMNEEEIRLGGEVAFLQKVSIPCGLACDVPDTLTYVIETVHKGQRYRILFEYDQLTREKQRVLDMFIESFSFL